jgi:uncharacterized paraquat-inducible protein A
MGETLLGILLVAAILGVGALLTHLFARAMYITCPNCQTLNAHRRAQCRKCGRKIRE